MRDSGSIIGSEEVAESFLDGKENPPGNNALLQGEASDQDCDSLLILPNQGAS